jgi:hypothetical protein
MAARTPAGNQVGDAAAVGAETCEPGFRQHLFQQPDGAAFVRRHRLASDKSGGQVCCIYGHGFC